MPRSPKEEGRPAKITDKNNARPCDSDILGNLAEVDVLRGRSYCTLKVLLWLALIWTFIVPISQPRHLERLTRAARLPPPSIPSRGVMIRAKTILTKTSSIVRRFYSFHNGFGTTGVPTVETITSEIDGVSVEEFRERAFIPGNPILITTSNDTRSNPADIKLSKSSIPAAVKWFSHGPFDRPEASKPQIVTPSDYLLPFAATTLPYEIIVNSRNTFRSWLGEENQELVSYLNQLLENSEGFHRFNAPLALFLQACRPKSGSSFLEGLYIAQAQIADLPKELQDDVPTPRIVMEAGKGDIYDANIWMGIPPTYTPLHKDPNPNLFVQLASSKLVRLFKPNTGAAMFREIQQRIGQNSSSNFRGYEMMEGPERNALDKSVWGQSVMREGFEVTVNPGDALFIPKGWWHSIKSIGTNVTASVNWWFR